MCIHCNMGEQLPCRPETRPSTQLTMKGHKSTGSPLAVGPAIFGGKSRMGCRHRRKEDRRALDQLALPWPAQHEPDYIQRVSSSYLGNSNLYWLLASS